MISLQLLSGVASQTGTDLILSFLLLLLIFACLDRHLAIGQSPLIVRHLSYNSEQMSQLGFPGSKVDKEGGSRVSRGVSKEDQDTSASVRVFVCLPSQGGTRRHSCAGRPHARPHAYAASRHHLLHELLVVRNGEHGAFEILERAHKPVKGLFILPVWWSAKSST